MSTATPPVKRWPGETDEVYPDVFTKIPTQPDVLKPGQLTKKQVDQYFEEGYVIVDNFFNVKEELEPVKEDVEQMVDKLANKLYAAGKIPELFSELDFFHRLSAIERSYPGANIILHKAGQVPPSVGRVWSSERLLNVAEQLLGTSDISGHPVWNLRTKTPQNKASTVPWHQDSGYLDNDSYKVMQLTAWIPLLDATKETGCMQMVPRGHRSGKIANHHCCWKDTWYIMLEPEEMKKTLGVDVKDAVTCPVPYGGVILFANTIPHRSLNNTSDKIRWSLDLRWQRSDMPVGFYGIKDGVKMRSSQEAQVKVDWEAFNDVTRQDQTNKDLEMEEDYFSTTIAGPWMKKWEITNKNRHVQAMLDASGSGTQWHGLTG